MKHLMITFCITLSLCASAWSQPAAVPAPGKAHASDPAARSNVLFRSGGLIRSTDQGPALLFINTQTRVPPGTISDTAAQMKKDLLLQISLTNKSSSKPVTEALDALVDSHVAAVIVIADEAGYPSLLVAPESRWAMINIAALSGNDATAEKLADRTRKEMWRAFGYLMGAAHSSSEHCLLKSVLSPTDLDALDVYGISPEPFNKFMEHANKLGMKPSRLTTYRKAVEEGWAPTPTNVFQKAVWDELKK